MDRRDLRSDARKPWDGAGTDRVSTRAVTSLSTSRRSRARFVDASRVGRGPRPDDWWEYQAWDDGWRTVIMDKLVELAAGDERAFAAGAIILLVGWQVGYDG